MAKEKIRLLPLEVAWKAGAYGISIDGSEADKLTITTIINLAIGDPKELRIEFSSFAEVRFFNFNFGEYNYGAYLVNAPTGEFVEDTYDWQSLDAHFKESNICPNPYFYEVQNSAWFEEREIYQALLKKNFKHFILVGYDSYVEVLARDDIQYHFS
ncbi:hypothetical protein [Chitinophaga vietnamensis]|uniref:hypothetical protein n=1 Tax=Chitinophaga vietnamensis TaxID=2593957 RepID=UPI0011781937|nr:hypothetical protein [Chitinophaga vietnamensis]